MTEEVRDMIVIGGASAAQSAAIYAVRAGMDVLVIADEYGGQINNTDVVENWLGTKSISGPDLAEKFTEHMREYEVDEYTGEKVVDVRKENDTFTVETESGEEFQSHAVIIATGGSRRRLNVPGEEEYRNKGVAYCAVCDGPLYQGEEVAVVGGGYAGTEAADYLSDVAEQVYLLSRSGVLKGEEITINKVENDENVDVVREASVSEFQGEQLLESVEYDQNGEKKELDVPGAFIEIGTVPNSDITDLVEKDDSGKIKVDREMNTGVEGLYAAGDVNDMGAQQLVVSAGQGCDAALNASEYVKQKKSEEE
ncbi:MAG: alkyl hydroperoxide reductase subunit F [Candidatus Nanohaloarchaea archaeon]|jgi:alkyl hydroperoxide reductase subunit F